jgi:YD repeat-containing protein
MRKLAFSILLAACSSSEPKLPSATFTPHLDSQETSVACGADFTFSGTATTLRYGYTYDNAGRLVAGTGTWSPSAVVDSFAYTYAGNNFDSYVWTSGWDGSQETVDVGYDASDNLVAYAWSYSDGTNTDAWTYAYSSFIGPNQPTHEDITHGDDPAHFYDFTYDADNRLVQATPDVGSPWTWTYDDAALTVTADLNNGEIHGVQTYDADYRPLSETWGGTHPDVVDQSTTYAWDDDRLLTIASTYGTDSQLETLRYDCAAARTNAGVMQRVMKPSRLH